VKDQENLSQNGIWVTRAQSAWKRARDANTKLMTGEMVVCVSEGTTNADTEWVLTAEFSPESYPIDFSFG